MNVVVIGANGQLGTDLVAAFSAHGDNVRGLSPGDIEIADRSSDSRVLESSPELVVNTAAMHHVENCEQEPEKAFAINAVGARNLGRVNSGCGIDARQHRLRL